MQDQTKKAVLPEQLFLFTLNKPRHFIRQHTHPFFNQLVPDHQCFYIRNEQHIGGEIPGMRIKVGAENIRGKPRLFKTGGRPAHVKG